MKIIAYKRNNNLSKIDQTPIHREWMDETFERHAYQCFPMALANRLGWSISFNEDLSFIRKSSQDTNNGYVDILKGEEIISNRRANGTVSFETGLTFDPQQNVSLLTVPPPNFFIDGIHCISTIISTSVLIGEFPIAIMVTKKDEEIIIPAGTPVATIIPISLKEINNTELILKNEIPNYMINEEWKNYMRERAEISEQLNNNGEWTHFYRDAVDHNGNKTGEHEVKKIVMRVINE
jgi:hypothetical protein